MSFLQNPTPILKQRKSEMNTNPLILGDIISTDEKKLQRKDILIETNREFTETIEDICYELYEKRSLKMSRRRLKWILVMIVVFIIMYFLINN